MSKINAVRFINLNYNNNAIRVSDETFHMKGESTLFSLRNGGGKSVLVQMMTAPFVHKRYRDAKDRPFASYFTSGKPTFILVEWALDKGAGYVLTGMMVRRSQDMPEDNGEELEMINFISEYKDRCPQDIYHLPVVEKTKKEMTLKNFNACRQLFESFKKDRSMQFFYYDMANAAQSRQYFAKLQEYQISYKEWETIIKKVNLKESGLSELFADCRDERGLVEKWFLEAVESKLNKEKNRIREFQGILEKYVGQYKDNRSKIERRDTIRRFKEEAAAVKLGAEKYQEASRAEQEYENRVANFIGELERLNQLQGQAAEGIQEEINALMEQTAHLEYERLSREIHELQKQERYHSRNMQMLEMERDALQQEWEMASHRLQLLECARQQEETREYYQEFVTAKEKLEVSRQQAGDLEPERKRLGYTLKVHYGKKQQEWQQKEEKNHVFCQECQEETARRKEQEKQYQGQLIEETAKIGALHSKISAYDEKEERFNRKYQQELRRNILGEYEPGEWEIRREEWKKELEQCRHQRVEAKKSLEKAGEENRSLARTIEDRRQELAQKNAAQREAQKLREQQEAELKERRVILRYLNLEEQELFATGKILETMERKLKELDLARRSLEKQEDELQREFVRLTQGKILELPKEVETLLDNLGLHYIYGMDWLKKNGNSARKNQKLVSSHPFLPYALILSRAEVEKLSAHAKEAYTSFPIPILLREQLEEAGEGEQGGVLSFPKIHFYVFFNENLLDEEKLRLLVQEKEKQIKKQQELAARKKREYQEYFEKQEKIKNQKVTEEAYRNNQAYLEKNALEISETEELIRQKMEEAAALARELEELRDTIQAKERQAEQQQRRLEDYGELTEAYEACLEQRRELERCKKEEQRLKENQKLTAERLEKLGERLRSLENEARDIRRELENIREELALYADYKETELQKGLAEELEARFCAITSEISREQQELEAQAAAARKRYEKAEEELEHLQKKYQLGENAWEGVRYHREEETHQEKLLEECRKQKEEKDRQWNEEDKKAAVLRNRREQRMTDLKEQCRKEEPLPEEEITTQDFAGKKQQMKHEISEKQKELSAAEKKIRSYEENLTALAEYGELECLHPVAWDQDFGAMDGKLLTDFKGRLLRDYRQCSKEKQECRNGLEQVLNRMARMEAFQEDFYQKPLESMLELTRDAGQVLRQLDTTIQSYDSLMEKLQVDISMVEKEKAKIVELLEDYVREVHQNLGKIDHNSTISIRERPVKMLKIQIPDWEENENLYQVRLSDFVDEITVRGMEIFEKNENAQEYFGTRVTTRNLYDTVVGIGSVQIRLYKIEEQREYAITWAEVAKNSGGEGFLSAFIILSSLLCYMRRDDSDLFVERNEGKVLVMDNPFAQTNASHLLKPLMDMAEKTNTQLICLSGLGGESIYNRFDNIYVLNLIAASLRSGMQYLKADHMRGSEEETLLVSRIEVAKQQELVF